MDLRQLEILRAVAESGSFTGAGRRLHVSQSAVSRQILLLEAELNEPLFWRIKRKVRITPTGEALLQLAIRVFQDIKETTASITETQEKLTGSVRLVGGMTVSLYVFPALLKEFRRQHPEVDVRVITGSTERLLRKLRSGAADLGLITLPIEEPDLVTVPVMREELMLVTYPSHPLAKRTGPAAVHPVRARVEHAARHRRVLPARSHPPAHGDGDRERRDHQGDGQERAGNHRDFSPGRRTRSA